MDYSFLSFTLDIWLILHIIISLFCKPPSKHFPVWKSIQVLHICNKKKKKKKILPIIGQHRQEDEEKHLSGFNGKWNFNKRDLTVPFFCASGLMSVKHLWLHCETKQEWQPELWVTGRVVTQIKLYRKVAKRGTAESSPLCFQKPRSTGGGWRVKAWVVSQILA